MSNAANDFASITTPITKEDLHDIRFEAGTTLAAVVCLKFGIDPESMSKTDRDALIRKCHKMATDAVKEVATRVAVEAPALVGW